MRPSKRLRRWIAEDPRHAAAFELATESLATERRPSRILTEARTPKGFRESPRRMAILCAAIISAGYFLRDPTLVTGPGEQRTVAVSDGTQVSLNANSRVVVQYDDRVRKLTLASGEVLFNVLQASAPAVRRCHWRSKGLLPWELLSWCAVNSRPGRHSALTLVEAGWRSTHFMAGRIAERASSGIEAAESGRAAAIRDDATEKRDSPSIER